MKQTKKWLKLMSACLVISMVLTQTAFIRATELPTDPSITTQATQSGETIPEITSTPETTPETTSTTVVEETTPTTTAEKVTETTTVVEETTPTTTVEKVTEATTVVEETTPATTTEKVTEATTVTVPSTAAPTTAAPAKPAETEATTVLPSETTVDVKKPAAPLAKAVEPDLYAFTPMGLMPAAGYPVDQDSLVISTQFYGTSINGQSTFDQVGQLWTYEGNVYIAVLTNMDTTFLYLGGTGGLAQNNLDQLDALAPLLIDADDNPATAPTSYPVGGTSGSVKKEHWSIFRYSLSSFLALMQANPTNSYYLALRVGGGHEIAGTFTVLLPTVTANLSKRWVGGPMNPVTLHLYRYIESDNPKPAMTDPSWAAWDIAHRYETVTLTATAGIASKTWTGLAYTNLAGQVWTYWMNEADPGQGYDASFSSSYNSTTKTYTFTLVNTYNLTPRQFPIQGTKTLNRPFAAGETFTMQLYQSTAAAAQGNLISQVTTNADGSFSFPAITYEVAGTYYYLVKEVAGTNPGMTYDTVGKLVTIVVTDNQDGTLSIAMTPSGGPVVANTYRAAPVDVTLNFNKSLSGRALQAGEFTFALYRATDASGTIVGDAIAPPATNLANGTASFTLNFVDGQEGTYYYTITEVVPATPLGGVTYSTSHLVYTVRIYDDNLGQLQKQVIAPQTATFFNSYEAEGTSLTLRATKILTGRALRAGEFNFELLDTNGAVVRTASNAADGSIVFSPALEFTDQDLNSGSNTDVYTYTVREVIPDPRLGGVTYDTGTKTLTVRVTDNGNGTMSAAVAGTAVFNNSYTTTPLQVELPVTKTLTGRTGTNITDNFAFTLDGANAQTLSFNGNDTKTFNYILNYNLSDLAPDTNKTFTYTIAELATPAIPGMQYDSDLDDVVNVTVFDNGNGTLGYRMSGTAAFTNRYAALPTSVTIRGSKQLSGRTGTFSDVFRFQKDGVDTQILTFTANGTQNFSYTPISYTFADLGGLASKTFTYQISELISTAEIPPISGIIYDSNPVRTVTVTLTDVGNGTMTAVADSSPVFMNRYSARDTSVTIRGSKSLVGRTGQFSDVFEFQLNGADTKALTFTANGTQNFSFTPISYTFADLGGLASKTFNYSVTELNGAIPGITYDADLDRDVVVTLRDNGDGTMSAQADSTPAFLNSYGATATGIQIPLNKTVSGRLGSFSDTFNFTLTPQTVGDPNTAKNLSLTFTANGMQSGQFELLTYSFADLGGQNSKDFIYSITETAGTNAGYAYDTVADSITVTVSDLGNGSLAARISSGTAAFTNTYTAASTTATIVGNKALSGRTGTFSDRFSFTLDGANQQDVVFTANGSQDFSFPAITYTHAMMDGLQSRTFTYTVLELATPPIPGIVYDALLSKQVSVTVTDNGLGQLSAVVNSKPEFKNTYQADPVSITLDFSKTLSGRTGLFDDQFDFSLTAEESAMPDTQILFFVANGMQTGSFAELSFTLADLEGANSKVFNYQLAELVPATPIAGMVYDSDLLREVSITVTDKGNGKLEAVLGGDSRDFNNRYDAAPIDVPIGVFKELSGRTGEFEDIFSFVLRDLNGETAFERSTGQLIFSMNGTQTLQFTPLHYTLADLAGAKSKTFYYEVEELIPDPAIPGMVYDSNPIHSISVTVTDEGNGTLTWTFNEDFGDTMDTFNAMQLVDGPTNGIAGILVSYYNYYDAEPVSLTLRGSKELIGRTGDFADSFSFALDDAETVPLLFTENGVKEFSFTPITYYLEDLEGENSRVFSYTVEEATLPEIPGIVYDSNLIRTINVTLTDMGDGTLEAVADIEPAFVNEYTAEPVDLVIEGSKTLAGRTGNFSDDFSFTLQGYTGMEDNEEEATARMDLALSSLATQSLNFTANGTKPFSFPAITYYLEDLEGASSRVFEYELAEVLPPAETAIPGMNYDPLPVRKVLVTLVDNGDGTLSAQADSQPAFTNIYGTDTATATISLKKVLSGRTGSFSDRFAFTLDGLDEQALTFTANGEQSLSFTPLLYTLDDLEGAASKTFSYTVQEINDAIPGMIYDPIAVRTVTVTVSDDGEGHLHAVVNDLPVFNNHYEAKSISVTISGQKTLTGRNGSFSDTFNFTLNGGETQNLVFTANGTQTFTFPAIAYSFADLAGMNTKLFNYTIAEVIGLAIPGMVYDAQLERLVTVQLKDNGDGTMSVTSTPAPLFVNQYKLAANSWTPMATKQLTGLKALAADDFTFEVKENGTVVSSGKNDASGMIHFSPIPYTAADLGTHEYEIHEVKAAALGITYDESIHKVTVVVSDKGDGTLTITPTYPEGGITFVNLFKPEAITHDPPVEKLVTGAGAPNDAKFKFQMKAITPNAPMPTGAVNGEMIRTITGPGSFEFGVMSYTEPGTYVYELRELPTEAKNFTFDPTLYTITITITSENGILKKSVVYTMNNGIAAVEKLVYTNSYKAPPPPIPRTGEQGRNLLFYALGLLAAGVSLFLLKKRRSQKETDAEL